MKQEVAREGMDAPILTGAQAVEMAVKGNQPEALARALSAGADPEGSYVGFGKTPLAWSALMGHGSCVRELIKAGAKLDRVDGHGRSPLMMASDGECVALLIEAGARMNLQDDEGSTAAFRAARAGTHAKINALGKAGANLEIRDCYGLSPLMEAAVQGHVECARALVDVGALVDAVDPSGRTALIYAAQRKQFEIVMLLVGAGADPMIKDEEGTTALQWARRLNFPEAADFLFSAQEAAELRASIKGAPRTGVRSGL